MIEQKQDLIKLTKHELLKIATDLDVKYRTRMGKPELVDNIIDVLQIKKKVLNPEIEKMLAEQLKNYRKDEHQVSQAKEAMQASKYQPTTIEPVDKDEEVEQIPPPPPSPPQFKGQPQLANVLEDYHHIPEGYGDNAIVLMVVDPTHLYSYWEVTQDRIRDLLAASSAANQSYEMLIKLHDVTDIQFNGNNAWSTNEMLTGFSRAWYFTVDANRSYCLEIGLKLADQRFVLIARSNVVSTPRDGVSDFYDEEWMMIDFNKNKDMYNELYRLSGGHVMRQYQLNSAFITEIGKNDVKLNIPAQSLSSESLSSQMKEYKVNEKDFWLWVDTELIVYGQTKSDAKELTINGEKCVLDKEGRFRLHMALPNGKFPFRVKAVSADGTMTREITPVVTRKIEK